MKLRFVELCGFRGFREKARIEFGAGFTVITGRNGVGKSTVCDAIEFALTGTIDKYSVKKAAQESLTDYLWWRGDGLANDYYVTASFSDANGQEFSVTRSRKSGASKSEDQIEAALCNAIRPEDPIRQLCKTSIIRDEWIAALSLDLSETDRFDLVRAALGPTQSADFAARAKAVLKAVDADFASKQNAYNHLRFQLTSTITQLSEAKEMVARAGDVAAAIRVLTEATAATSADLAQLLSATRSYISERRQWLSSLGRLVAEGRELSAARNSSSTSLSQEAVDASRSRLEAAESARDEAGRAFAEAINALKKKEDANSLATSLAHLIESGERLGRHDDHCPLCAASRSAQEFSAGLSLARRRMETLTVGISEARQRAAAAKQSLDLATSSFNEIQSTHTRLLSEQSRSLGREQMYATALETQGIDPNLALDPEGIDKIQSAERDRLVEIERALITVEVSQASSRVSSLEERVLALRRSAESAAIQVENAEKGLATARAIERGVRSISGEIIDERLAQISPLLNELYQRLRPHVDWRSIEYSIRGDVQRFLSLKVGEGLNPQFVFSSGQRRAAGLAFLLSVHLARAWTPWRTLVLDDPVQHIDDFRALHLVEVLAALRLEDRQIICAVEDSALADLLCRRLQNSAEARGRRYEFDTSADGSAIVAEEKDVPPMPTGVLRATASLQAAI
jgi:chromosome segregation protein